MNGVILRPMVGRRCDLLWVAGATYRGSYRRPTVGFPSELLGVIPSPFQKALLHGTEAFRHRPSDGLFPQHEV